YDAIQDLPYLNAVLHESLRINPITASGFDRDTPEGGGMLDGYYIPEGTTVLTSILTLQRDKEVFPEPLVFKPERWIDASPEQLQVMQKHFIPFLVGPRACLGRK
ncbi:cytochrome P450, partial [Syncephalis pseudoplumigaleata]